ncbi:hypothetical protein ACTI_71290 [Actinoplanes sp. OR16]|nr:hypothetical protein ACTI_71290 [Actinoplanes sp. OR16]
MLGRGVLVLVLLLAGCTSAPPPSPSPPWEPEPWPSFAAAGQWQAYPGVFTAPPDSAADVGALILHDSCFQAVGTVTGPGDVSGIGGWRSAGDCTAPARLWPPAPPGPGSSGFVDDETLIGVVNETRGSLFNGAPATVVRHRYSDGRAGTEVLTGPPSGWASEWFPGELSAASQAPLPSAVGEMDAFLLAAGRHGDRLATWNYLGFSWDENPLPAPDGAEPLAVATRSFLPVASSTKLVTAVIVGEAGGRGVVWWSLDAGRNWKYQEISGARAIVDVVHDGNGFVALAETGGGPLVLESRDGLTWTPDERPLPATGPLSAIFELSPPELRDRMVLGGPPSPSPMVFAAGPADAAGCANVYRRDATAWVAEPLGCHGAPSALLALRGGRIAAAGGGTLWLRS